MSTGAPPTDWPDEPGFTHDGSPPQTAAAMTLGTSVVGEVVAALTEPLIVVDAEGNVVLVNPSARALIGLAWMDVPVHRWTAEVGFAHLDGQPLRGELLPVLRALRGETVTSELMLVRTADSHAGRVVECNAAPIWSDAVVIAAVMTLHDVTDRRRREADLESFATMASHDLQQPIRLIRQLTGRMLAEVATVDVPPDLAVRLDKYAQLLTDYGERAHSLVEALLQFSRSGQVAEPREIPLDSLVASVVSRAQAAFPSASFEVDVGPDVFAFCDAPAVELALDNLVTNACRYVAPGVAPSVAIVVTSSRNAVEVAVTDNGIGIAAQHLEAIWRPLFRLHPHTEYLGSGIGLSVTRRLIEASGGSVAVTSTPSLGSTFRVTLRRLEALATRPDLSYVSHMLTQEERKR